MRSSGLNSSLPYESLSELHYSNCFKDYLKVRILNKRCRHGKSEASHDTTIGYGLSMSSWFVKCCLGALNPSGWLGTN